MNISSLRNFLFIIFMVSSDIFFASTGNDSSASAEEIKKEEIRSQLIPLIMNFLRSSTPEEKDNHFKQIVCFYDRHMTGLPGGFLIDFLKSVNNKYRQHFSSLKVVDGKSRKNKVYPLDLKSTNYWEYFSDRRYSYADDRVDYSDCVFDEQSCLSRMEFRGCSFSRINMNKSNLFYIHFIPISYADLCDIQNFNNVQNFNEASFVQSRLKLVHFVCVSLPHVDFSHTTMRKCSFENPSFYDENGSLKSEIQCFYFSSHCLDNHEPERLSECKKIDFSNANFNEASLEDSRFINADFKGVQFKGTNFKHGSDAGGDKKMFFGCIFAGCDLTSTNISNKHVVKLPKGFKFSDNRDMNKDWARTKVTWKQAASLRNVLRLEQYLSLDVQPRVSVSSSNDVQPRVSVSSSNDVQPRVSVRSSNYVKSLQQGHPNAILLSQNYKKKM
jgi:uncharacterized protein YjbI with pentapeptide repeats